MIRKLDKTEYALATSLALEVYIQCGAEDFDEEGLNSFKSFISNEQLMNELVIYFLCIQIVEHNLKLCSI